jgi:hypothetical protein
MSTAAIRTRSPVTRRSLSLRGRQQQLAELMHEPIPLGRDPVEQPARVIDIGSKLLE